MHPITSFVPAREHLGSGSCRLVPFLALADAVPVAGVLVFDLAFAARHVPARAAVHDPGAVTSLPAVRG